VTGQTISLQQREDRRTGLACNATSFPLSLTRSVLCGSFNVRALQVGRQQESGAESVEARYCIITHNKTVHVIITQP
jgi:hypothetical protein